MELRITNLIVTIITLLNIQAFASNVVKKEYKVNGAVEAIEFTAQVACVHQFHPGYEDDELSPEVYFVNTSDYKRHSELLKEGFRRFDTFKSGKSCDDFSMKDIVVLNLFSSNKDKVQKIKESNVATKQTILYISSEMVEKQVEEMKKQAFEDFSIN